MQDPRTPCPVVSVLPEALLCSGLVMGGTDKHSRFTSVHQDTALRDVRECKERLVKPPLLLNSVLPSHLINSISALQNALKGFEDFIF